MVEADIDAVYFVAPDAETENLDFAFAVVFVALFGIVVVFDYDIVVCHYLYS